MSGVGEHITGRRKIIWMMDNSQRDLDYQAKLPATHNLIPIIKASIKISSPHFYTFCDGVFGEGL
jgi:hypothetical protein